MFQNRNKEYGAYELRRLSFRYQIWGLLGTIVTFSSFLFLLNLQKEEKEPDFEFEKMIEFKGFDANLLDVQPIKKEEAPPQKKEEVPKPTTKDKDLPPEVVKDKPEEKIKDKQIAEVDSAAKKTEQEGKDSAKKYEAGADSGQTMVKYEEGPASYYGGVTAFSKWVQMNIHCPDDIINGMMVQATVEVFFNIDTAGNIRDVRLLKGFNSECDKEVVRVISGSPKWKPRVINGIPVVQRTKVGIIVDPKFYKNRPPQK